MSDLIIIDADGSKHGADAREMSDEQREAAVERLAKARAAKGRP